MTDEERKNFFHDGALYNENRNKMPREVYVTYADEHVAFSLDGTCVLAHGKTFEEAWAAMQAAGLDPEKAVYDHLEPADVDCILPSLQDTDLIGDGRAD